MPKISARFLHTAILIFLIIFSLTFFVLSSMLSEANIKKFSPDNEVSSSTLEKAYFLRKFFVVLSIIFSFISLLFLKHDFFYFFIEKHKEVFINIFLLAIILLLFIFVAEIIFRFLYYDTTNSYGYSAGSVKFIELHVQLNEYGFRDINHKVEKPENTKRVVVLGDSYTFGAGIRNVNNTYPRKLEKLLNEKGNFEVLSFAIGGFDTYKELEVLKNYSLKYDPDFIVIGYALNDFLNVYFPADEKRNCFQPLLGYFLRFRSYFYFFIEHNIDKVCRAFSSYSYEDYLASLPSSEKNREYNEQAFSEIALIAKEKDIPVVVMIIPIINDFEDYKFLGHHKFIHEIGSKYEFIVIDLLDYYEEHDASDLYVNSDDSHINELGHEIASEKLFEIFEENYLEQV